MCDIGRFDYHWVEGPRRLLQPHVRKQGSFDAAPWADALVAATRP
jgi:predicted molibdopterin-dependent oxidoreductase YjgC